MSFSFPECLAEVSSWQTGLSVPASSGWIIQFKEWNNVYFTHHRLGRVHKNHQHKHSILAAAIYTICGGPKAVSEGSSWPMQVVILEILTPFQAGVMYQAHQHWFRELYWWDQLSSLCWSRTLVEVLTSPWGLPMISWQAGILQVWLGTAVLDAMCCLSEYPHDSMHRLCLFLIVDMAKV